MFMSMKELLLLWWLKMSEWKYNVPWRPNFEAYEVAGWSFGIASSIAVNMYLDMPSLPCYLAVAVQAAYGIRALPAAYYVAKHKHRGIPHTLSNSIINFYPGLSVIHKHHN